LQATETNRDAAPLRVLVVDDESSQRLLVRFLVQHCYPTAIVAEAQNGQAALTHYEVQGADLIITDIHMPILDGIALTAAIRARNSVLPIIVISGAVDGEALACLVGASRYLNKSVLMAQLPKLLADVLVSS
jgi:CheY-like chemotaxis protein